MLMTIYNGYIVYASQVCQIADRFKDGKMNKVTGKELLIPCSALRLIMLNRANENSRVSDMN